MQMTKFLRSHEKSTSAQSAETLPCLSVWYKTMTAASSNLNRFSKRFHCWGKPMYIFPIKPFP